MVKNTVNVTSFSKKLFSEPALCSGVGEVQFQVKLYDVFAFKTDTPRHAGKVLFHVADPVTSYWIKKLNSSAESLSDCCEPGLERRVAYHKMIDLTLAYLHQDLNVCVVFYGHPGFFVFPSHGPRKISLRLFNLIACIFLPSRIISAVSAALFKGLV